MTSNAPPPPSGGPPGRRRALGRGPAAPPADRPQVEPPPAPEEADPAAPPAERPGSEAAESPLPPAESAGTAHPVELRAETVQYGASPASAPAAHAEPAAPTAEPGFSPHSAGPAASSTGPLKAAAPGQADTAQPTARPAEAAGHLVPPVDVAGPSAPAAESDGRLVPPEDVTGPVVLPVEVAGPAGTPVESDGRLVPPVGVAGPTAPHSGVAGPVVPPVDVTGPAGQPVDVGGTTTGAAAETRAADVASAFGRPAAPPAPSPSPSAGGAEAVADDGVFTVRLANFEGPFDLLLQLISRHKMDVTEVALSKVTDEFMAHIRAMGPDWDLDETTEFLVVAATLLDLKAARLLPAAEVEDEGDLALLEARDLLFARLLQYRAYKQIADIFSGRLDDEARRYPRTVGLEAHHAELLPDVVISIGAEGFAKLAVKAMQPRPKPQVYVDHIHAPLVSVQEQAQIVVARLRELGEASFRALVADTDDTLTVVARFLALLELYREKAVALEQETALGDLLVRWTGGDGDETPTVTDEFDRPPEPPKEEKKA